MASYCNRIIRGLGVFTVIILVILAFTPAANIIGRRLAVHTELSPSSAPIGAIVVLGAGLLHGGILEEESMRRAVRGIELYKMGLAPLLVFSGARGSEGPGLTEAAVRTKLATDLGVSPEAILTEEANTTREEGIHIAAALRLRNVTKILLVTESLHMRRAKLAFQHAGLEVTAGTSADYTEMAISPWERLWLFMRMTQEAAALIYYRMAGYI